MMRVSPPELAREFAGPYASISATRCPRLARCHAVHAPKTPAPMTAMSYVRCTLTPSASYRNLPRTKNSAGAQFFPQRIYEVPGSFLALSPELRCDRFGPVREVIER